MGLAINLKTSLGYNLVVVKKFLVFILLAFVFFLARPVLAQEPSSDSYVIESFDSRIALQKDTSLLVTETIKVNFPYAKHGIFRNIPVVYSAKGKTLRAGISVLSVVDATGAGHPYKLGRQGREVEVKIGDPDKTITGEVVYVITYRITKIVQRFDTHDEIYWNITGAGWDTEILKSSASVSSPFAKITQVDCFAGDVGTTQKACKSGIFGEDAMFGATQTLGSGRDFTIVVALEQPNLLVFPGKAQKFLGFFFDNWGYAAALLPLVVLGYFWYKRGRDRRYVGENIYYEPEKKEVITKPLFVREHLPFVYYPINGLTPAQVGTIVDERVDIADIIAEILELARLGLIKIKRYEVKKILGEGSEYAFIRTQKDGSELPLKDYQKDILKELFRSPSVHSSISSVEEVLKDHPEEKAEADRLLKKDRYVLLSALKNHFYEGLPEIKKKLYQNMQDSGYFEEDPEKARGKWLGIGVLVYIVGYMIVNFFGVATGNFGPLVLYFVSIVPSAFAVFSMPRRTPAGYALWRQIKGLKHFLKVGKWRHQIAEKHLFIEEILPLAVSLGVVNQLAGDMKDLGISPPSYFSGFVAGSFYSDFSSFTSSTGSSLMSAPGGSAGGFSGGSGFGGGGGAGGGGGGGGGGGW